MSQVKFIKTGQGFNQKSNALHLKGSLLQDFSLILKPHKKPHQIHTRPFYGFKLQNNILLTGGVTSSARERALLLLHSAKLLQSEASVTTKKWPLSQYDPGQHWSVWTWRMLMWTDWLVLRNRFRFSHYWAFFEYPKPSRQQYPPTGRIYNTVITKERKGEYLGKTLTSDFLHIHRWNQIEISIG